MQVQKIMKTLQKMKMRVNNNENSTYGYNN